MSYREIAIKSWNDFSNLFENDMIVIKSEADIRSYFFTCCFNNMINTFPTPLKIYTEFTMGNKIPDIVLGEREIAIEIKYLREGASQTFDDLKKDVYKVSEYIRDDYVNHSFIAFVDERGSVRKRVIQLSPQFESWNEVVKNNKIIILGFVEITL